MAVELGLLLLTKYPEIEPSLPQESLFVSHYKVTQLALQAYQNNNIQELNVLLKQLPYRSAFKDFRVVLNAVLVASSGEQIKRLLDQLPEHSPYASIAQLLSLLFNSGHALFNDLNHINYQQRSVVCEMLGLTSQQLEFVEHLSRQYEHLSDKIKFNMAIQYQSLCGTTLAQKFCQTFLANYPEGFQHFNKNFGSVNEFEENRIKALTCERDNNFFDADYYWHQCIRQLDKEEDNHLKIALIFRHMALLQKNPLAQVEYSINSLEYDADDRDSYMRILNYYSQSIETAETYQQWLQKSVEQFPEETEFLFLSIQEASRLKESNKTREYAEALLKIDPLNVFAKQTLYSIFVAHARRCMRAREYDQVENNIQQAEKLKLGKDFKVQLQVLRELLIFAVNDRTQGKPFVIESLSHLYKSSVNRQFKITMEALLTGISSEDILNETVLTDDYMLSRQEIALLNQQIKDYILEDEGLNSLTIAIDQIKPILKTSLSQQTYDENLLVNLCETLNNIHHYELMHDCAISAISRWNKPFWVYYFIYSEIHGEPEHCSFLNIRKLQTNQALAEQEKDHRAKILIDGFLQQYYVAHPSQTLGFLEKLLGIRQSESNDDPMEILFGHFSDEILFQLHEKIERITQKITPEKLAEALNVDAENNDQIFLAMMEKPDLFNALMVVQASDQLGIDIDVSADDVLNHFNVIA